MIGVHSRHERRHRLALQPREDLPGAGTSDIDEDSVRLTSETMRIWAVEYDGWVFRVGWHRSQSGCPTASMNLRKWRAAHWVTLCVAVMAVAVGAYLVFPAVTSRTSPKIEPQESEVPKSLVDPAEYPYDDVIFGPPTGAESDALTEKAIREGTVILGKHGGLDCEGNPIAIRTPVPLDDYGVPPWAHQSIYIKALSLRIRLPVGIQRFMTIREIPPAKECGWTPCPVLPVFQLWNRETDEVVTVDGEGKIWLEDIDVMPEGFEFLERHRQLRRAQRGVQ